jgi:poly-gamma-glutamate synthesis protein (capsule biosynthesis protein)
MKQIPCCFSILILLIIGLLISFDSSMSVKAGMLRSSGKRRRVTEQPPGTDSPITLFLCGDVMIGRGIDQVLPHPGDPLIHEPFMKSARGYVDIAERVNGPVPRPVSYSYVWGDALGEWARTAPDVKIINLETSVTKSDEYRRDKSIHYRMHPENIPVIESARIDACSLANNHILDWGHRGLTETLETLRDAGVGFAGAGRDLQEAEAPAVLEIGDSGRVIVFSAGAMDCGIPPSWAASPNRPGVSLLSELSEMTVGEIGERVREVKRAGDVVILSVHWGSNWGYRVPRAHVEFAHALIDHAHVDVIHGHSSHHPRPMEVYRDKPILYGCGDFLNDYEGIGGHEEYRHDLALMYFLKMDPLSGMLVEMRMTPLQIRNFKLNRASREDISWLRDTLNRECRKFGTRVELSDDDGLKLLWK